MSQMNCYTCYMKEDETFMCLQCTNLDKIVLDANVICILRRNFTSEGKKILVLSGVMFKNKFPPSKSHLKGYKETAPIISKVLSC